MGVFIGDSKNTSAARSALQINYLVLKVVNEKIKEVYPNTSYQVKHAVGIDTSDLFIARTGIRGSNDLVWVGRAANYAAKLCSLRESTYNSYITEDVYNLLSDELKFGGDPRRNMWEKYMWITMGITVYRSSWWWKPD